MSYTPTEWVTGDTITAEKLNNMESGIANAKGYSVAENTSTVIAEQSVETALMGAYGYGAALSGDISGLSDGDSCIVSFNGTDYTLEARVVGGTPYIGEADFNSQGIPWSFATYPFFVVDMSGSLFLFTEEAVSCTISVVAVEKTITPNSDFIRAVNAVGDENVFIFRVSATGSGDNVVFSPNVTYSEIREQQRCGKQLFASVPGSGLLEMTGDTGSAMSFTDVTILHLSNRYELWQGGFVINSDNTVETLTTLKFSLTEAT